ncbi:uncharacterized protein LACBIDRAFT_312647 [Laccaria bicolor S238N-H82]|uniref:Predicted protein n=1 Tax=Laccaria bicolor (strain S238N-H82 / ATCC MYA-4686) TaxID=486041 RepID=B0DWJ9_LACBS|nr:uncharacterized protein LACBIDRAFT_312647 [Laccaria bicolor S238N-H82]EDR01104.1 predicted protein [Laccaria bicolor S238N-H82]|eukprot:XP_001888323.1 predicted protein [Laccaria bicolor S238N-H82]
MIKGLLNFPLWKHPKVFVHNQYVGVNQNSLKHHAAHPRHNREASTLLPTPSTLQLQILIPPSEFTWPTSPASLRADNLLHDVEAGAVETSLKSRQGCFNLIPIL